MLQEPLIMKQLLHVIYNDQAVLQYDRNKVLPPEHSQYLDNMDERMDEGIDFEGSSVTEPNPLQKAQFIANLMITAIISRDSNQANAMCTYLGDRIPDLKQIICKQQEEVDGIQIEFVYDKSYQEAPQQAPEQTIKFFDPKDFVKH